MLSLLTTLDKINQVMHVVGIPGLGVLLIWGLRTWDTTVSRTKEMHELAKTTAETITVIQNNHLAHLQDGMARMVASNEKSVELLHDIDKHLAVQTAILQERK